MQLLRLAAAAGIAALLFGPTAFADSGPETTLSVFDRSYDTASVGATASPADATLHCNVDGVEQTSCGRIDLIELEPGTHTFTATAVDGAGVADPTPLVHSWVASESPDSALPSPPNDNLHAAQQLAGASGVVVGTTLNASRQWDEPYSPAPTGGEKSVWYQWRSGRTGEVTFTVSSDEFVPFVGQGQPWIEPAGVGEVTFQALQSATYRIVVDTNDGRAGAFTLSWAFADDDPPNDYLADSQSIEGVSGSVRGTTAGSTLEPNEPDHGAPDADSAPGNSIWYRWTAPATGDVFFTTEGSAVDTDLSVYSDGTDVSQLVVRLTADDLNPWTTWSRGWFRADAGATYAIAVAGHDGAPGDVALNWRMTIPSDDQTWPTVTPTAPAPDERIAGTYTFTAEASDDVAVDHVEWQFGPNDGPLWLLGEDTTAP
jgi:Bacterial Ig domain